VLAYRIIPGVLAELEIIRRQATARARCVFCAYATSAAEPLPRPGICGAPLRDDAEPPPSALRADSRGYVTTGASGGPGWGDDGALLAAPGGPSGLLHQGFRHLPSMRRKAISPGL
jgi:hypothetical protein